MELNQTNLTFILGSAALVSILFNAYNTFRNPQIKSDGEVIKLKDDISSLKKEVSEIKETHLKSVENDLKTLTSAVNELSKTVVKLSTIIDERIPRTQK